MEWYPCSFGGGGTENKTVTFNQAEKRENIKSGEKHKTIFGKIARWFADLKTVAFTGSYNDLSDKPSSLPASDVPAWAKAAGKPSYSWNEIGSKPSSFPPSSHGHTGYAALNHSHTNYAVSNHTHEDYAPKADPVFKGTVSLNTYAKIGSVFANQVTFYTSYGGSTIEHGVSVSSDKAGLSSIYGADNRCTCGGGNTRWKEVYAVSSTISTSDKREKYDISYIGSGSSYDTAMTDEMLVNLIMGFAPVVFKRTNGDSGRPHHGILSQDFEELMKEIGLTDHAAFIKSPVTKMTEKETENADGSINLELVEEVIPGEYRYGMRYEELITDIIRFCQILWNKTKAQEEIINQQQEKTKKLEEHVAVLEKIINQAA